MLVNPTGTFELGGPHADCGLTGRKIIVDTYGGMARHGGGAFSGKDPTKVDRSAAYAVRHVAKNVVAAGHRRAVRGAGRVRDRCRAPGVDHGRDVRHVGDRPREARPAWCRSIFDLRPAAIIERLDLRRPIYQRTAAYGHFGRTDRDFTWERTDHADELRRAARSSARADACGTQVCPGPARRPRDRSRVRLRRPRRARRATCASARSCACRCTAGGCAAGCVDDDVARRDRSGRELRDVATVVVGRAAARRASTCAVGRVALGRAAPGSLPRRVAAERGRRRRRPEVETAVYPACCGRRGAHVVASAARRRPARLVAPLAAPEGSTLVIDPDAECVGVRSSPSASATGAECLTPAPDHSDAEPAARVDAGTQPGACVVAVGGRTAVWAPVPDLAAVVVLDEGDEALRGGARARRWNARDVALERARRAGARSRAWSRPRPTVERRVASR